MKLTKILFSPTGGTEKVCNQIAEAMDENAGFIDLCDKKGHFILEEFTKEDVVIIGMPSYGGRAPMVAADRLSMMRGGGARAVLVCVYGNRAYEDTLVEMQDVAEKAGFVVIGSVAAIAEHSMFEKFGKKRPDKADSRRLKEIGKELAAKVESGETAMPTLPGNRPYKDGMSKVLVPKSKKSCISCGQCVRPCPVGAISKKDPRQIDKDKCIGCMRCVSQCPVEGKKLKKSSYKMVELAIEKQCKKRKEIESYL